MYTSHVLVYSLRFYSKILLYNDAWICAVCLIDVLSSVSFVIGQDHLSFFVIRWLYLIHVLIPIIDHAPCLSNSSCHSYIPLSNMHEYSEVKHNTVVWQDWYTQLQCVLFSPWITYASLLNNRIYQAVSFVFTRLLLYSLHTSDLLADTSVMSPET